MTNPFGGPRHGSALAALSVLGSAMTGPGQTAAEALAGSIDSPGSPAAAASPAPG